MNTIEAYEYEVLIQLEELPRILKELERIDIWLSRDEQSDAIITGSGDSYVAALAVERLSSFRVRCVEPHEFATSKVSKKILYIISISGETRASIEAARAAKSRGMNVIALTANKSSRLASIADTCYELRFKKSGMLTAGSVSFTVSLLYSMALLDRIHSDAIDVGMLFKDAGTNTIYLGDTNYIIGDVLTYPIAVYFSAKIGEVLGSRAFYCMLEQFSHMQIFSLHKDDNVIILTERGRALADGLKANGANVTLVESSREVDHTNCKSEFMYWLNNLLYYTFIAQLTTLNDAKRIGLSECSFINNRLLRLSTSLIY